MNFQPIPWATSGHSSYMPVGRPTWGAPLPNGTSYPIREFPGLTGRLAHDLGASGGVAPEIVGTELIVVGSLLTQGLADAEWPNGKPMRIGANAVLASPSGSGKSLVYRMLVQPIEEALSQFPGHRVTDGLLIDDPTRATLLQDLPGWPVAGLLTDEAGMLKRLLKEGPTLVKLLEGTTTLRSSRISTGRIALAGQRLCMLLIEQPELFEETKRLLGPRKGGQGLINRFFLALIKDFRPESSPQHVRLSADTARAYATRISELLEMLVKQVDHGAVQRPTLRLSHQASRHFDELAANARRCCSAGSPWAFASEYILRHAERVLGLAGAFHVFERGAEGEISLETLTRAERLGDWYVESFARIFYEAPKRSQAELDADDLQRILFQAGLLTGTSAFRQSEMRMQALNQGITSIRFSRALAVLCRQGRTRMVSYRNSLWIELLNPNPWFSY